MKTHRFSIKLSGHFAVVAVLLVILIFSTSCAAPAAHSIPSAKAPDRTTPAQPAATAAERDAVRVNIQPFMGYAPFIIAKEEGLFEKHGIEVEFVTVPSAEAIPMTMAGQLDLSAAVVNAGMFNAIGKGGAARVVMGLTRWSADGCVPAAILGQAAQNEELEDVRNWKKLATATDPNDMLAYFLDTTLAQRDLTLADIEVTKIPAPAMIEALGTGAIQLAIVGEPWVTNLMDGGNAVILQEGQKTLPDSQFSVVLFGEHLLDSPDQADRIARALLEAFQQYQEGATDRNVEILSAYTGLEPDLLRTVCWASIPSDGSINTESMMAFQEWMLRQGSLDSVLTPDQFIEKSILNDLHAK